MTHKQKDTQLYTVPRPSIDGVDNAAELYRQFDEELGYLLNEEDVSFDVSDVALPVAQSAPQTQPQGSHDHTSALTEDAQDIGDVDVYVKDDKLDIRFQGEKKKQTLPIGTRQYSDSSQARDTVLADYQSMIRKEEALARIARQPEKFAHKKEEVAQTTLMRAAQEAARAGVVKDVDDGATTPSQSVDQEVEVVAPMLSDLDTGSTLGGRAALMSELSQSAPEKSLRGGADTSTQRPDVVRLSGGAAHSTHTHSRARKERPGTSSAAMAKNVGVTYRTAVRPAQNVSVPTPQTKKPAPQPARPQQSSRPQPTVYQLGRAVEAHQTQMPPVIASQYVPQKTPTVIDPATPTKNREGIVAFFDYEKKEQSQRADGRAHASLGSQTFAGASSKRSFADVARRVRNNQTDEDAADFLDEGKITFVEAPQKKQQEPVRKTPTPTRNALAEQQLSSDRDDVQKEIVIQKPHKTHETLQVHTVTTRPQRIGTSVAPPKITPDDAQRIRESLQKQAQKRLQLQTQASAVKKKIISSTPSSRVKQPQHAVQSTPKPQPAPQKVRRAQPHVDVQQQPSVYRKTSQKTRRRNTTLVTTLIITIALVIFGGALVRRGADLYTSVKGAAERGFESLQVAVGDVKKQDFVESQKSFQSAASELDRADASFAQINGGVIAIAQYVPFLSKVASGKNAIDVGQHIARAGTALSKAGQVLKGVGDPLSGDTSLLAVYQSFAGHVSDAQTELIAADAAVAKISVADIPEEQRGQFVELKEKLPVVLAAFGQFQQNNHVIADLLGANGPRKYLFLFQNNHEMRATGGFIGSYGRLDISGGSVKQFFIDGIFNPDGQLTEKIIPPRPIQKISAAWSLHDSNWFPHFPTSAEEAIVFYERTGGPTVDGVIAITPIVLERFLAVTGPVHLPDYDTDITAENFMERLQYEVEIDYDKEENKPKKILSDLAPVILSRIFATTDGGDLRVVLEIMGQMLAEKHIQLYARNPEVEGWIDTAGWGGEIADVPYDYLSVINTNINGYKTDGVVDESIYHWADIQKDGSIVDTVRIVRKHNGGHTPYEWWNKVNANYMRVFVPQGAELLRVSGQTREFVEPPLDYRALGFQSDARVVQEEQSMTIDDATGTRIYEQNGKTVFANWVYVSPQETVTVEYSYKLPFRLHMEGAESADTYSILFQKQAGSVGSRLVSEISVPAQMQQVWSHPESIGTARWETMLATDQLRGVVLAPTGQ